MLTRTEAKRKIVELGASQRGVARILGCSHTHLCYVLNGQRESRRLMRKIEALKPSDIPEEMRKRKFGGFRPRLEERA